MIFIVVSMYSAGNVTYRFVEILEKENYYYLTLVAIYNRSTETVAPVSIETADSYHLMVALTIKLGSVVVVVGENAPPSS